MGRSFQKMLPRKDLELLKKIRQQCCFVCGRDGPSDCAHITVKRIKGDERDNVLPLCRPCHSEQHQVGIKSFVQKYRLPIDFSGGYPRLEFEWSL